MSIGCNRTYYGNLGMTNTIELIRPKDDRLPFICELNFTAAGGNHGDIVQVCIVQCLNCLLFTLYNGIPINL